MFVENTNDNCLTLALYETGIPAGTNKRLGKKPYKDQLGTDASGSKSLWYNPVNLESHTHVWDVCMPRKDLRRPQSVASGQPEVKSWRHASTHTQTLQ